MKEQILLIGGGGHCKSVIDVIELEGRYSVAGIIDKRELVGSRVLGYDVIGCDDDLPELFKECKNALVTVGQIKSNEIRVKLFGRLKEIGFCLPVVISPLAYLSRHASVGEGSVVMHGAMVNAGAKVGKNCIINTKALVEHDAVIEDGCHISTGAIINGGTVVKENSFFGSNAMAKEYIEIKAKSVVGGGSYNPKKPLKIGYFADGEWSHNAFRKIHADSDFKIMFITPRWDTADETLKGFADDNHIAYIKSQNINSKDYAAEISKFDCDIFVSMSFNQIFKEEITNLPPLKTINCHAGKLPFYRGRNILNWALINDEKEFGITVHYVDSGIDTGDIILQRVYGIDDSDTYSTLLEKAYIECAETLYDALKTLASSKIEPIKQSSIHPVGFYCSQRKESDEIMDWNQSSREIFNFIRAICRPAVMATSFINGQIIKINKAEMVENAPEYKCIAGAVVGIDKDGFIVKTKDSTIKITEYEYDGKIKIGDRLGK